MEGITKSFFVGKGNTGLVNSFIDEDSQSAVIGLAPGDRKTCDQFILPLTGGECVPAMPHDIIITGASAAPVLHGRFNVAHRRPALTMGTLAKSLTPRGAIEKTTRSLTEKN